MPTLIFWIIVFGISLALLIKSSDLLLTRAEKIGLALGLTPFIVGALIVGVGTSFPELISSLSAVFQGVPDVVVANAVGSNIANILLILGLSAIVAGALVVTKELINLDLPLLALSTSMFLVVVWDGRVSFAEAVILLLTYGIYLAYSILQTEERSDTFVERVIMRLKGKVLQPLATEDAPVQERPKMRPIDFLVLLLSVVGLAIGAKYLIESVITLSAMLNIAPGIIAITAVAVGTSLPELLVSVRAALRKQSEVALGNIFGSNVFNALVVVGLPALFSPLPVDAQTFAIGVPVMAGATLLFIISGISRRLHLWEGGFFLALYVLFVGRLFDVF